MLICLTILIDIFASTCMSKCLLRGVSKFTKVEPLTFLPLISFNMLTINQFR